MGLKVACIKWGKKYPADYANRLHHMVERHLSLPHEFLCLTDDPRGLKPDITAIRLTAKKLTRWWAKLELFRPGLFSADDVCLFLDLDVVITGSLDSLFNYQPENDFLSILDWCGREPQINSSVMRFRGGKFDYLFNLATDKKTKWHWERESLFAWPKGSGMMLDGELVLSHQLWLSRMLFPDKAQISRFCYPQDWILSYKRHGRNGLPTGCKIMVFHGLPKPHQVDDGYVINNWS